MSQIQPARQCWEEPPHMFKMCCNVLLYIFWVFSCQRLPGGFHLACQIFLAENC